MRLQANLTILHTQSPLFLPFIISIPAKIEFDIKKDQMKIIASLAPIGYIGLIIERGKPKNNPYPRIKESGEQDTVIIES